MERSEPLVLVVDAVDEAGSSLQTNPLLSLLSSQLLQLPPWVRLLVTSRPEDYIKKRMSIFCPHTLEPQEDRNRADILAFILGSLRQDGLTDEERAWVGDTILQRSEGVFAYVAAVVRMVQTGEGNLGKIRVGDLPQGHRALYRCQQASMTRPTEASRFYQSRVQY